jgi:hypothetical protein
VINRLITVTLRTREPRTRSGAPVVLPQAQPASGQFQSFGRLDELFESRLLSNPPTMAPPT